MPGRKKADAMVWGGQVLSSYKDLMEGGLDKINNKEDAQEFMRLYKEVTPNAEINVGYLSGYYGPEAYRRIHQWFGVVHPVFGTEYWTPQDAFNFGVKLVKESLQTGKTLVEIIRDIDMNKAKDEGRALVEESPS